ncbi:hypothetical protein [Shimia biformata]|uniref:hypothetical protein n=1 Tax=Shimia biformata TaxID=1294299 RepID=UPI00194DCEA7|nr:hypothetical protein [Shimia biformata]
MLMPGAALADACTDLRPNWDGTPVSALDEFVALMSTPPALVLLLATALVVRFRKPWGGVVVALLWGGFGTFLTWGDPTGLRDAAIAEGCVGSPSLFIASTLAICAAMIAITAPAKRDKTDGEN